MTWREIHADQNLRMAGMMLDQQGQLNELNQKVVRIRAIARRHRDCSVGCDALLEILEVLGDE